MVNARIVIGDLESPDFVFENENLDSIICDNAVSLTGGEMTSDVLEVTYYCNPNSGIKNISFGKSVTYYSDNEYVGEYYLTNNEQVSKEKFTLRATSIIGIIENENFYGGKYTAKSFKEVAEEILFTDGLTNRRMSLYDAQSKSYPSYGSMLITSDITPSWYCEYDLDFTLVDFDWSKASNQTSATEIIAGQVGDGNNYADYYIKLDVTRSNTSSPTVWAVSLQATVKKTGAAQSYNYPIYSNMGNGSRVYIHVSLQSKKVRYTVSCVTPGTQTAVEESGTKSLNLYGYPSNQWYMKLGCAFGACDRNGTLYSIKAAKIRWHKFRLFNYANGGLIIDAILAVDSQTNKTYVRNLAYNNIATMSGYTAQEMVQTTYYENVGSKRDTEADLNERQLAIKRAITYAEGIADLPVSGWIRIGTKREALHQLLFSQNVSLIRTQNSGYIFTSLSNATSGEISDDDIYMDGKEEKLKQAKQISLTEYSFSTDGSSSKVIFDNSASDMQEGNYIAVFNDAPISGAPTAGTGITIHSYNCNAAVVSGRGTISGLPFIQSKNVVTYKNQTETDGTDITVSDIGLITTANSDNVASRLKAYYFADIYKITCGLVYRGEKCGATYSLTSPFEEQITAFLTKYSARASSFLKADCEFCKGFSPVESGGYTSYQILTKGTEFIIPQSVRDKADPKIRLNIIGNGSAGTSGANGEVGHTLDPESGTGYRESGGEGGKGGKGGTGGNGGKVYVVTVNVASVYKVTVEQSGSNIIVRTKSSSDGTINTYSSANGNSMTKGFTNVFTGITYATKGPDGIDGGDGGKGGGVSDEYSYKAGEKGQDVGEYKGGSSRSDGRVRYDDDYLVTFFAYGGGGGASARANGGNTRIASDGYNTYGGKGADGGAAFVTMTNYGCGGSGGNGGGGGGGAASYGIYFNNGETEETYYSCSFVGQGGNGGAGSAGIEGCALIYY